MVDVAGASPRRRAVVVTGALVATLVALATSGWQTSIAATGKARLDCRLVRSRSRPGAPRLFSPSQPASARGLQLPAGSCCVLPG